MIVILGDLVGGAMPVSPTPPKRAAVTRSAPTRKQEHATQTQQQTQPKVAAAIDRHTDTETVAAWALENTPDAVGVERVGAWIWLTFPDKPGAEMRAKLKESGFHWAPRRQQWAHPCGVFRGKSKNDAHPRQTYGSIAVRQEDEDEMPALNN